MVDIPRMVRSKSQKLLGAIEAVLNLPVTLDRQLSGEAAREARSLVRARSYRRPEEEEYEAKFTGESIYQSIPLASLLTDRLVFRQRGEHGGAAGRGRARLGALLRSVRAAVRTAADAVPQGSPLLRRVPRQLRPHVSAVQAGRGHGGRRAPRPHRAGEAARPHSAALCLQVGAVTSV